MTRVINLRPVAPGLVVGAVLSACGGGGGGVPSDSSAPAPARANEPVALAPVPTGYTDATLASGIEYRIGYQLGAPVGLVPAFATGSVAAGDYDADGDVDLFITRGDIGSNLLYRNNGRGAFLDVAATAGVAFTATASENYRHGGPIFADMDGDGDLDLFIGGLFGDPSLIFANNADGTFVDVTAGSGIDGLTADFNISAAFGDYDLDGDLDLFVCHWGVQKLPGRIGDTEHLWRNDSDATGIYFVSVSIESGIAASILTDVPDANGKIFDSTFTPTFARINDDRFPDLLSVADHGQTRYFLNNGDGTFTNATDPNVITDDFGMGSAVGDFDNDGDLDWFVTSIYRSDSADFSGNRLYRNDAGTFADATPGSGTRAGGWGWGACAIDFENDGLLDIYHTNG
jgi:hypothetical protein